jgi:putative ABC transport system permease protein
MIKNQKKIQNSSFNSFKIGLFLAYKNIRHSSPWITVGTISAILLLFLVIMIISGILVGLIQGSEVAFREKYLGDVIVSPLDKKNKIERAGEIMNVLEGVEGVKGYSARYLSGGSVEANYNTRRSDDIANKKQVTLRGINPEDEDVVTNLSENILEGEYLTSADASKYILVGKDVLAKYSIVSDVDATALRDVEPGTKVRLQISSVRSSPESILKPEDDKITPTYEYIVKGIVKIKAGDLSTNVFMVDSELRKLANKNIADVDEIAVRLEQNANSVKIRDTLKQNGFGSYAKIQTFEEGTPSFVIQLKDLFSLLGSSFGFILMIVASITLFIVIFINALTKRRQIGILKGIGIRDSTILWSYVFQAMFYAAVGSGVGVLITFFILKPFFDANPIDFPFSDGILVAETGATVFRVIVFMVAAIFAGLVPSWMVVRRNTLNAILGR